MNQRLSAPLVIAILSASAGTVHAEFTGNIGVTSNYVWRGVTQTDNQAAVQGGLDYTHASGFYLGAWASNVDFPSTAITPVATPEGGTTDITTETSDTGFELDLYTGFGNEVGDFAYDVGLIYYTYTDSADANFLEAALAGSWKFLFAGVNYTIAGDAEDDALFSDGDIYYYGGLNFALPMEFGITFTIGHYDFDVPDDNVDYTHYQIDLTKSAGEWGDVTLSAAQAEEEAGNPNGDDTMFLVSWGKSF